jgi:alpha-galactosidase
MKSILFIVVLSLVASSCVHSKKADVICTFNDKVITIRNAGTTIRIDNDFQFEIFVEKNNKLYPLTGENKTNPSIFLRDSTDERISFTRKSIQVSEINDKYGKGETVKIGALSGDDKIRCNITLSSYDKLPSIFLVRSSFINVSLKDYSIGDYTLNQIFLRSLKDEPKWWSFQGASYREGNDFAFQLPESFSRENYMGLNAKETGGGLPIVDVWNKEFGLALAYLGEKPCDLFLPVKAENGIVSLGIKENYKNQILNPGDSLVSVQTAIIVHQNDFFDPLRMYSILMKPFLPDFQKPVDFGYQPEWCTWGYSRDFKPEQILGKLEHLKAIGIKSVILDDGWSPNHGDWVPDPKKFPGGDEDFKRLINKIHESGLKVWIWWMPGYTDSKSLNAAQHADWLIEDKNGSVDPLYAFCPAFQPVQDYYKKLVQKFVEEFKLDGLKMDFARINSAPPCYNPKHHHNNPYESFYSTPVLFQNICETARGYNPNMLFEYCSCGIPPTIFHLPWTNLMVTSDPRVFQITQRIKLYKALMGSDFPVLEEYCGVLAGPVYQLAIGTGGVPGTFSTNLDNWHEKWLNIYQKYQLSKGEYLNLYDIGFDYPEAHVIKKDGSFYYAFYTHPWKKLGTPRLWWRYGNIFDFNLEGKPEFEFPIENYSGKIDFRGLDKNTKYKVVDYVNNKELGIINGNKPDLQVSFDDYLLVELNPLR